MPNLRTMDHLDPARLAAFGRGILDHDEMAEVEGHLAVCESCCQVLCSLPDDEFAGLLRSAQTQSELALGTGSAADLTARMPGRQNTRAHNRAKYIASERRRNHQARQMVSSGPAPHTGDDAPPF